MAEAIGAASGLLTLSTFAFDASIKLYTTVKGYQSHPKQVRDLLDEIQALVDVLGPLTDTISANADVDLSALRFPLRQCGNACSELEKEIKKCLPKPDSGKTSLRGWARLRYMGDDINGFRGLISGYKLTISIALADAHLRKSSITAESIKAHEELVKTAKADLGAHLESLDEKMELILERTTEDANPDETEMQKLKDERLSTEKCLEICTQLSQHIGEIASLKNRSASSASEDDPTTFPERVVSEGLQECQESLNTTAAKLGEHMNSVWERLLAKSKTVLTSEEEIEELSKLKDQWETTRQCIDICSKADRRMRENVSNIVNHSTGDAVQFMVSTDGNIINGTNKGLGWRSRQVGGHLNDATVQQISRDFASVYLRHPENGAAAPHSTSPTPSPDESSYEFTQRYGRGSKLSPKSTPQGSMGRVA
ncbi:hypothetical protein ASPVEDRAFT_178335 [Aspergillus versicolor CBS 583.65]|uniref:Azaphilone pigments biosynthesis cluster protein L N-terminal domain-containing protein n=1 Tax=Aspergillus versicolor CBS 583.65 TaxID=1036611 RepID=A0A1L9Q1J3_ASPVE|nr:uncharacterized protein ASPVEDRAFT_178335 [Aspergillus versicolor CBS 583.65]OJJ07599.1 hypothetical protein ASPVEDRAFT_178335 [Aspergillus versicolor CBS 583.65]